MAVYQRGAGVSDVKEESLCLYFHPGEEGRRSFLPRGVKSQRNPSLIRVFCGVCTPETGVSETGGCAFAKKKKTSASESDTARGLSRRERTFRLRRNAFFFSGTLCIIMKRREIRRLSMRKFFAEICEERLFTCKKKRKRLP